MLWIDYAYDVQRVVRRARRARRPSRCPTAAASATTRVFRDAVAGFYVDAQALLAMGYRGFSKFLHGKSSPEHSLLKLFGSEALQQALLFGAEALGVDGLDIDALGPQMWREGIVGRSQYLRSFGGTIPGGTSEIQRNIIAERVLGLAALTAGGYMPPSRAAARRTRCPRDRRARPSRPSPWPMSTAVAPSATSRSTSASRSSGARSMCSRFLIGLRLGHRHEHEPRETLVVLADDDLVVGLRRRSSSRGRSVQNRASAAGSSRVDDDGPQAAGMHASHR